MYTHMKVSTVGAISLKSTPANATSGGLTIRRSRQATDPVASLTVKNILFLTVKTQTHTTYTHTLRMRQTDRDVKSLVLETRETGDMTTDL